MKLPTISLVNFLARNGGTATVREAHQHLHRHFAKSADLREWLEENDAFMVYRQPMHHPRRVYYRDMVGLTPTEDFLQ